MHVQLPNNITDLSITFFAGGRPHEIQRSHKNFELVRTQILNWNKGERSEADVTALINLADPKQELLIASGGRLEFAGNEIRYGGVALHNLWVDKIIGFKDAGEEFGPIFLALEDLQKNPTPAARERLPIFVERSKLGFLPDGRIAAFKGVRNDFYDVHSGTVHYGIGKTVAMDRAACNANPDQTCTTGLHLGAIDYINKTGFGWSSERRMLLCAFWPRHVVAVPTDYNGGKMRVEQLTVLDEVDKGYVTELLSKGTLMVRGYEIDAPTDTGVEPEDDGDDIEGTEDSAAKTDPTTPAAKAKVGDWVKISSDDNIEDGEYLVTHVDDADKGGQRLSVRTGTSDNDFETVYDDSVDSILTEAPIWARAKVGDWVEVDNRDLPQLVIDIDENDRYPDGSRLKLRDFDSEDWADNSSIEELLTSPPDVWMRVIEDDVVRIEGHALFRDGEYTVVSIDLYAETDASGELYEISAGDSEWTIRNDLIKSIKREVEETAAIGAAAAAVVPVAPVVPAEPAWKRAKVGDIVVIQYGRQRDGNYEVERVHDDDSVGRRLRVKNSGGNVWADNASVVKIVTPVGSATETDTRPIWEQVLAGDKVRIEGDPDVSDGEYIVRLTDESITNGPDGVGVRLEDDGYVYNKTVKDILERDGKPFGAPAAVAATPVAAPTSITFEAAKAMKVGERVQLKGHGDVPDGIYPIVEIDRDDPTVTLRIEKADGNPRWVRNYSVFQLVEAPASVATVATVDTRPAHERAKIGDRVRLEGSSNVSDGVYEVTQIDEGDSMRLKVRTGSGDSTWIRNDRVKDVVARVEAPGELTGPDAYKQAKVGDMVEVSTGQDHPAGTFKVTEIGSSAEYRIAVDYQGRNSGIWWISNRKVTKVIPAVAQAA